MTAQRRDPLVALTTYHVHDSYARSQYVIQYHPSTGVVSTNANIAPGTMPRTGNGMAGIFPARYSAMTVPTTAKTMTLAVQMPINGRGFSAPAVGYGRGR